MRNVENLCNIQMLWEVRVNTDKIQAVQGNSSQTGQTSRTTTRPNGADGPDEPDGPDGPDEPDDHTARRSKRARRRQLPQNKNIITKPDAYGSGCSDRFSDTAIQATSRSWGRICQSTPMPVRPAFSLSQAAGGKAGRPSCEHPLTSIPAERTEP